ncbi:MAG: ATP-binding protein [Nocardioides sp.]
MRQVLDALVDNAVRVTPAGGRVVVAVRPTTDGGGVRLRGQDSGPGLTAADAASAFEPGVLHDRYGPERAGGQGSAWRSCTGWSAASAARSRSRPPGGRSAAFVVSLP